MKKLDQVPQEVLNLIQTEHERALALLSGQSPVVTLPTRQVKMRIDRPSMGYSLEDVIVPGTLIYYKGDTYSDGEIRSTNALLYHLSLTKKPFPFGHIYKSSGSICLGGIFVPARISSYNLSQPLEALFLKNDHHTGHGGAYQEISLGQIAEIDRILEVNDIILTDDSKITLKEEVNLIKSDAIWILSADIRNQLPLEIAICVMDEIFNVIFLDV